MRAGSQGRDKETSGWDKDEILQEMRTGGVTKVRWEGKREKWENGKKD